MPDFGDKNIRDALDDNSVEIETDSEADSEETQTPTGAARPPSSPPPKPTTESEGDTDTGDTDDTFENPVSDTRPDVPSGPGYTFWDTETRRIAPLWLWAVAAVSLLAAVWAVTLA